MRNQFLFASTTLAALAGAQPAGAVVTIYTGVAENAPPGTKGALGFNEAAFKAAADVYGRVVTESFETQTIGTSLVRSLAGKATSNGVAVVGSPFSGVSNAVFDNSFGYNVTSGGSNWFGFPGTNVTISFSGKGTYGFGFFITGATQSFWTQPLTITQIGGSARTFTVPVTQNGGVAFYGIIDTVAFKGINISKGQGLPGQGEDAWGIDDVSFNPDPLPEPSVWALLLTGFGLAGGMARRSRVRAIV
jgi:hypothetical protein